MGFKKVTFLDSTNKLTLFILFQNVKRLANTKNESSIILLKFQMEETGS